MWIVMISRHGGYEFHSAHWLEGNAEAWEKCKQHDGEDTALLYVNSEGCDSIRELLEPPAAPKEM